jgi:hypothetical protein
MDEFGTISGALILLANIVMAWNTHRIQAMIDASPGDHTDELMRRLAHPGLRRRPPQIEPASRGAIRRLGARAEMKNLTFSKYQRLVITPQMQPIETTGSWTCPSRCAP